MQEFDLPSYFIYRFLRTVEVKFISNRTSCSDIERDPLTSSNHLDEWFSDCVPDGQLVKNVWIVPRQVSDHQRAFDDSFNYLAGNNTGLRYLVGPECIEPQSRRRRSNDVP